MVVFLSQFICFFLTRLSIYPRWHVGLDKIQWLLHYMDDVRVTSLTPPYSIINWVVFVSLFFLSSSSLLLFAVIIMFSFCCSISIPRKNVMKKIGAPKLNKWNANFHCCQVINWQFEGIRSVFWRLRWIILIEFIPDGAFRVNEFTFYTAHTRTQTATVLINRIDHISFCQYLCEMRSFETWQLRNAICSLVKYALLTPNGLQANTAKWENEMVNTELRDAMQ